MNMLALTILLPLIGFVLLAFSRGRWSENLSATHAGHCAGADRIAY